MRHSTLRRRSLSRTLVVQQLGEYRVDGEMRQLTGPHDSVTALLRANAPDMRIASCAILVLLNPDLAHSAMPDLQLSTLPPQAGAAFTLRGSAEEADASYGSR